MSGLSERDVKRLAEVIWTASRADESTISATGANIVARAIAPVVSAIRDEALAPILAVHRRYFDLDGRPGRDDTTPEPEDVWRYDRDFRVAALLDGGDQS